jgi:L-iditol 2-dehydrogenase
MKTLRLHGVGELRLADEPVPVPGPGEALVRVTAVGICGSDLHWYDESAIGEAVLTQPLVLGHEAAGVIVDGPRAGERVAIDPQVPCGACETCASGRGHLCPRVRFLGHSTTDGALREFLVWPIANLMALPDTIDDVSGAMLEPLGVGIHALRLARVRPGDAVAILGCGPIGLLLVQLARLAGATTIVATDRLPHRVEAARSLGAVAALVEAGAERAILRDATGGRGVDAAIEIAGEDDAIETAIALARPAGTVVVAGIPAGDHSTISASIARRKGLDLRFSRRMNRVYPRAIALVEAGLVDVSSLVTHRFTLDHHAAAFRTAARREGLKVVVEPSAGSYEPAMPGQDGP